MKIVSTLAIIVYTAANAAKARRAASASLVGWVPFVSSSAKR